MKVRHGVEVLQCHDCGRWEHIGLIDATWPEGGDENSDYTLLLCIRCYPPERGWAPTGVEHIAQSVCPELKPLYDAWSAKQAA